MLQDVLLTLMLNRHQSGGSSGTLSLTVQALGQAALIVSAAAIG